MQFQRRFYPDIAGIILVLAALTFIVLGTLVWNNTAARARGSIYNQGEQGVSQFAGWLAEEGYTVRTLETDNAYPGGGDGVMFVLAPRSSFSSEQLFFIDLWVQNGGTLIIAQEGRQPTNLIGRYQASIGRLWLRQRQAGLHLPVLNWPPVGQAEIRTSHYVRHQCGQAAIHMGSCERPYLVAFGRGNGRVFILSTVYPFTNAGIQDYGNAQLVENLALATVVNGRRVVFDELHQQIPLTWLFTTPAGWAFWLSLLALLLFFLWHQTYLPLNPARANGRERLPGAAPPLPPLATAQQQFARPEAIKTHYWQRLKRTLAQRHGLDPARPDPDFVEALNPYLKPADMGTVVYLYTHKEQFPPMTEAELKQWASLAIDLCQSHILTREIYEHQSSF